MTGTQEDGTPLPRSVADGMICEDEQIMAVTRRPTAEEYAILDSYAALYAKAFGARPAGLHYLAGGLSVHFAST